MPARPTVVLLRAPRSAGPDPYEAAFAAAGFDARSVPVLEHVFHPHAVARALADDGRHAGLVLTSPRAAHVLALQVDALLASWRARPVYVVGQRTAEAVRALGFRPLGADAGDAATLAARLVALGPEAPLLFLASDRRRDTLPEALAAAGVPLTEVTAYTTEGRPGLGPADLRGDWLAFFSPSGVEAAAALRSTPARRAAIGATTAAALAAAGRPAHAVADAPTPAALVAAVRAVG